MMITLVSSPHQDLQHPLYNPAGGETATTARLPAEDSSVDVVLAISLFTHLSGPVIERYLHEAAPVLAPGGRLFATFFLIDTAARQLLEGDATRYRFDLSRPGPLYGEPEDEGLLSAVALEEDWLLSRCAEAGLRLRLPVQHGFWPTGNPAHGVGYQDICVFAPAARTPGAAT